MTELVVWVRAGDTGVEYSHDGETWIPAEHDAKRDAWACQPPEKLDRLRRSVVDLRAALEKVAFDSDTDADGERLCGVCRRPVAQCYRISTRDDSRHECKGYEARMILAGTKP